MSGDFNSFSIPLSLHFSISFLIRWFYSWIRSFDAINWCNSLTLFLDSILWFDSFSLHFSIHFSLQFRFDEKLWSEKLAKRAQLPRHEQWTLKTALQEALKRSCRGGASEASGAATSRTMNLQKTLLEKMRSVERAKRAELPRHKQWTFKTIQMPLC